MKPAATVIAVAWLCAACSSGPTVVQTSGSTPSPEISHVMIVFTTWVPDAKVINGPEPGFRPALTGLTSHYVRKASASLDATGTTWVINLFFTPAGSAMLASLTAANVAACPGDPATGVAPNCARRHLAMWVDLTQSDIDSWDVVDHVRGVSQPFDMGCLTHSPAANPCGKLLTDPITLQPITGGELQVGGNLDRQSAMELAAAIS